MKKFSITRSLSLLLWALCCAKTHASIAYGSINNFDTVNDTGQECHGFEIEIEDCHTTDISYTYDYNHYGVPRIYQDDSIPGHPRCHIRWESKKKPDGSWAAYTAIPSGPIAPTDGHMFTNPSINFGGEHFGVGYMVAVGAVHYHWLVADAGGNLVNGGDVQVATPVFTYYPPVFGNPAPAQVQAVIAVPPEPVPVKEFGSALWMKEIRTTTHNAQKIHLRDLVSDDPEDAHDANWRNNEPDEVEVEWQILQKDFHKADGGANEKKAAAPEELPDGDEVVTRRYEFFAYTGPFDDESGEAMAQSVGADDLHGSGTKDINGVMVDLSTIEVVGEFKGAQMAAVDVDAVLGLVDHVSEAVESAPYAARSLVVPGALPYTAVQVGDLPAGMTFNETTGVLDGTPTETGEFQFTVVASDSVNPEVVKNYTLNVSALGEFVAPHVLVDTTTFPTAAGTTIGDGTYAPGEEVTVIATPEPGYHFVNWVDHGEVVSVDAMYSFVIDINHSLIANFAMDVPQWTIDLTADTSAFGQVTGAGVFDEGSQRTVLATASAGYSFSHWSENGLQVSTAASYTFTVATDRSLTAHFVSVPTFTVALSVNNPAAGNVQGAGNYAISTTATVQAIAEAGFVFSKWTVNGATVSTVANYSFTVAANRTLVAHFIVAGTQQTIAATASPASWGSVSGQGNYAAGDQATLVAVANPNYKFSKWTEGGATVSTSASYSFPVTANRTLVAKFVENFLITVAAAPSIGGEPEMDSASYKTGEKAKAKALPLEGFAFVNWTENGIVVSTNDIYDFDVTGPRNLVAHYQSTDGFTVIAQAAGVGGNTTGDGVYQSGDMVSVSAMADEGYAFVNWTEDDAVVSTSETYDFLASTHRTLTAHFTVMCAIDAVASTAEAGEIQGVGAFAVGDEVSLTTVVPPGFAFRGWREGATFVSTNTTYTFSVTAARSLIADFIALPDLQVVPASAGQDLIVCWPVASEGWLLQESSDLVHWVSSVRPATVEGDLKKVSIQPTSGAKYFRLSHP